MISQGRLAVYCRRFQPGAPVDRSDIARRQRVGNSRVLCSNNHSGCVTQCTIIRPAAALRKRVVAFHRHFIHVSCHFPPIYRKLYSGRFFSSRLNLDRCSYVNHCNNHSFVLIQPMSHWTIVLVLVSVLTLIVLVLVLPLLSWSCASRPRQFKTPVEKRHQPTDSPVTQLAKCFTMIKRDRGL